MHENSCSNTTARYSMCVKDFPKSKTKAKKNKIKKTYQKGPELFVAEAICAILKCRVNRYSDL